MRETELINYPLTNVVFRMIPINNGSYMDNRFNAQYRMPKFSPTNYSNQRKKVTCYSNCSG